MNSVFAISKLFAGLLVAIMIAAPVVAESSIYALRPLAHTGEVIESWDVYAGEIQGLSEAIQRAVIQDSGATAFRILVRNGCYNNALDDGSLEPDMLDRSLIRAVNASVKAGAKDYYTVMECPPPSMRKVYSPNGLVDFNPNPLLREREQSYAHYMVNLMRELRARGLPLPVAHGIQVRPRLALQEVSCRFEPAQWWRVLEETRKELDEAGLKTIKLLGPDEVDPDGTDDFLARVQESPSRVCSIRAIQRRLTKTGPARWPANATVPGPEIWITGHVATTFPDESSACAAGVAALIEELLAGARRWCWGQSYYNDYRADALVYGNAQKTRLGRTLEELWHVAPGGSAVRRVSGLYGSSVVVFEQPSKQVFLCVNRGTASEQLKIDSPGFATLRRWSSTRSDQTMASTPSEPIENSFIIEPSEVVIATIERAEQPVANPQR